MCSQQSPAPADSRRTLLAAVSRVAENGLFAFADPSDQAAFDGVGVSAAGGGWLRARVRFTGLVQGQLVLTVPEALARGLCAAFAGVESADPIRDADLIDFSGELANMVCGGWLSAASPQGTFALMPPQVVRGGPARAETDGRRPLETFYVAINDRPVRLEVECSAG